MSFTESDMQGMGLCSHGERRKNCGLCAQSIGFAVLAAEDAPPMLESKIEAECTKLLEEDGWRSLRTDPVSDRARGKGFGELGMADHMYIRYSTMAPLRVRARCELMWVEFKRPGEKAKKHQIEWHQKERARGALTFIAGQDFDATVDGFKDWYANSWLKRNG